MRIKELDALRGIAAIMVVLFHYTLISEDGQYFFKYGTTGVDLFFIISGFVIYMSLSKGIKVSDFIINRFSRIYPTYWAGVSFTFLFIIALALYTRAPEEIHISQYLGNMTMIQFYLNIPDLDGPYWTMIIELLFYILMIALYRFKLLKNINLIGTVTCVSILIIANLAPSKPAAEEIIFWFPLLQFFSLFLAGIAFYKVYTNEYTKLDLLILILCFLSQVNIFEYAGRSHIFINRPEYGILLGIYFCFFILLKFGKLKFIVNRFTLFLGRISYALYLTHQYFAGSFLIYYLTKKIHLNYWLSVFLSIPVAIGIAAFITFYIEIPGIRWIKTKFHTITKKTI